MCYMQVPPGGTSTCLPGCTAVNTSGEHVASNRIESNMMPGLSPVWPSVFPWNNCTTRRNGSCVAAPPVCVCPTPLALARFASLVDVFDDHCDIRKVEVPSKNTTAIPAIAVGVGPPFGLGVTSSS